MENTQEIQKLLKTSAYDFLRTDENLKGNLLYLALKGSISYGTNIASSDVDIRGITLGRKESIFGLNEFEQFECRETDTVIYALKKAVKLLLSCNPNLTDLFGVKQEHVLYCSEVGQMLKDNIDLFMTKRVIGSYGGYATAQLRRLQNALIRDVDVELKEQHILNSLNRQMLSFKDRYADFGNGHINLFIDEAKSDIIMNIDLKNYSLREFKSIYSEMNNTVVTYDKLNHRNKKKSEEKLDKHAMHLILLLVIGAEILEGKGINTYRYNDKDFFLDIRSGKYSYSQIFEMVDEYEKKFDYAAKNTSLPDSPNLNKIDDLCIAMYEKALYSR